MWRLNKEILPKNIGRERERERLPFDGFHPVGGGLPRRGPPLGECNNIQPFIEFINFFLNNAVVAHGKKGI